MNQQISFQSSPSGPLSGEIRVPSDKSISHRALMLSSLAKGVSKIEYLLIGEDNMATLAALKAMGVCFTPFDVDSYEVRGLGLKGLSAPRASLNLGNSGTGMRLLTGLLAAQSFDSELVGDVSLMRRPMRRIVTPLTEMGARIRLSQDGTPPIRIAGTPILKGIDYAMPVASAQVKSCLLLAGLYAQGVTRVTEPGPTRDHTERMLEAFSYSVQRTSDTVSLQGGGVLQATQIRVPGDISSAAFFMVAATLIPGSDILLTEVGVNPTRIGVLHILQAMGANLDLLNLRNFNGEPVADIRIRYAHQLQGIEIPVDQVPLAIDELPVLMIAAACAKGVTHLRGAEELRVKETDRIAAMEEGLKALGVEVQAQKDGMIVNGGKFHGGCVCSHGDHRIAMAFAVAGACAQESVMIADCDNVETSFPGFVGIAKSLGMSVEKG